MFTVTVCPTVIMFVMWGCISLSHSMDDRVSLCSFAFMMNDFE